LEIDGLSKTRLEKITWHVSWPNRKSRFFQFWGRWACRSLYGTPLQTISWLVTETHVARAERDAKLVLLFGHPVDRQRPPRPIRDIRKSIAHTRLHRFSGQCSRCRGAPISSSAAGAKSVFAPALALGAGGPLSDDLANNNGWFDDIADGTVSATLHFRTAKPGDRDNKRRMVGERTARLCAGVSIPIGELWDRSSTIDTNGHTLTEQDVTTAAGAAAWLAAAWDRKGRQLGRLSPSFTREIFPIISAQVRCPFSCMRLVSLATPRFHDATGDLWRAMSGPVAAGQVLSA